MTQSLEQPSSEQDAAPEETPAAVASVASHARPRLWNPNAAGLWSLLFSPAFGALLHAKNWRTLGNLQRAKANMVWFWFVVAFLALAVATMPLGDVPGLDRTFQIVGIALLIVWFYRQCKPQMQYVKEHVGDDYERRGWGMPLGIGAGLFVMLLASIILIGIATYQVPSDEVIGVIRPQILSEWRNNAFIDDASIQDFRLTAAGDGRYNGEISATINGQPEQLDITVEIVEDRITWQLQPVKP